MYFCVLGVVVVQAVVSHLSGWKKPNLGFLRESCVLLTVEPPHQSQELAIK